MANSKTVIEPLTMEKRLVSVSVPIEDVEPMGLLRLGKGGPRGFWAREGRWFAHIGQAAIVKVGRETDPGDRFSAVWAMARSIFSCSWRDPQSQVHPPPPRLFGGFSFGGTPSEQGPWKRFPAAHFSLPEVELMGGEDTGVLTLRRHHEPSANPAKCRQELRDHLESIKRRLLEATPEPSIRDVCIPATRYETDPEEWGGMVGRTLSEIADGTLTKVVLARVLGASFEGNVDHLDVVRNLWKENPGSHIFLYEPSPGHVLLGAAPETVATVAGGFFQATAVAGSVARGSNPEEQASLARQLQKSEKDQQEHRVCVSDMVTRLAGVSDDIKAAPEPRVLTLSTIQHLETGITAHLHPEETVLSALAALHPTPAVCGLPREAAMKLIRKEERFDRGWYAGPVGWFDNDGNGEFVPALRSALGSGREWKLFSGAGIMAGSDPSKEWAETRIKFQAVLRALSGARIEPSSEPEGTPAS